MAWLITFTLTEHVSVQEKREARASGKATTTKQTGNGSGAAAESDEQMTWFERRVLKPVNDALE